MYPKHITDTSLQTLSISCSAFAKRTSLTIDSNSRYDVDVEYADPVDVVEDGCHLVRNSHPRSHCKFLREWVWVNGY